MSTTEQATYRRRTPSDLRNRPTKQLLKDVNYLKGLAERGEITPQQAETLRLTKAILKQRTGGIRD